MEKSSLQMPRSSTCELSWIHLVLVLLTPFLGISPSIVLHTCSWLGFKRLSHTPVFPHRMLTKLWSALVSLVACYGMDLFAH